MIKREQNAGKVNFISFIIFHHFELISFGTNRHLLKVRCLETGNSKAQFQTRKKPCLLAYYIVKEFLIIPALRDSWRLKITNSPSDRFPVLVQMDGKYDW